MPSNRVPIVPPFSPEDNAVDIFDLERYRNEVGQAVIEWRDVRKPSTPYEPAPFNRNRAKPPHFYELEFRMDWCLGSCVEGYLRRALNLSAEDGEDRPSFIAVHIRKGNFVCHGQGACGVTSMHLHRLVVRQVQEELRERNGVDVDKVILTSDETDDAFWDEGEDTFARYGEWYLPIIEVVIQGMAKGFVGSPGSTFSLINGRHVVE
ncbi:hypothetical protein Moror_16518 [Moniliophthora roreri MCA 2997]|uniref:Uncharacterized protein n=1 Tax=Moniliophthora roreri (strain MCA 2997) TaxID=1381753 RepID=V2XAP9_MONRO|nr:hypothetical protein Moror_16518 [Moniliophthora roreri MCA 2997]